MPARRLTPEEQRARRAYIADSLPLEDTLDRQLRQDTGMPHLYYSHPGYSPSRSGGRA